MPTEHPNQLDIVAWHRMLRDLYVADPLSGSLAALTVMDDAMRAAAELRLGATWDQIVTRGLVIWDRDFAAEQLRLARLREFVELSKTIDDVSVRDLYLTANVYDPIFRGRYPADWFGSMSKVAQSNMRGSTDGTLRMLGGDASGVATLYNQMSALQALTGDRTLEWLGAAFNAAALQLEVSAPGEAPTAADAVRDAIDKAAATTGDLLASVGGKVALVVGGLALVGGLLLWAYRTR